MNYSVKIGNLSTYKYICSYGLLERPVVGYCSVFKLAVRAVYRFVSQNTTALTRQEKDNVSTRNQASSVSTSWSFSYCQKATVNGF